jgi:hypothetical protein
MNKGRSLLRWTGFLAVAIVSIYGISVHGVEKISTSASTMRTDVIKIDAMTVFGKLERPPVEFLHETHTEALTKKNKDCSACHLTEKNLIMPKFKRLKDTGKKEVMDIYHRDCISCHKEMKASREKSGPVECGGCHREKALYTSTRQPVGFDNSLHLRHLNSQEKKCERCHHEYDEKTQKLFYAKEKEGTCRYCHKKETKDKVISMSLASHIGCINCHSKNIAKKISTGPVKCSGCHDLAAQQKIEKIKPLLRMERKQPDFVMLKTAKKGTPPDDLNKMNFVPFDHKSHEEYNSTCRVCHHESLKQCNECHTLAGIKEGKDVKLEKAMHQHNAEMSCRGCHGIKQNDKNCAGCHVFIGKTQKKQDDSCLKCHFAPVPEKGKILNPEEEKALAGAMLKARKPVTGSFRTEDIPEKVSISKFSKKYEAAEFPHRKVLNTLVKNTKDNRLAGYFHKEDGTLCQGCHHNSPAAKKPPRCDSCHGKPFDPENPLKPGIIGAYHQQCMGCHKEMGIAKPAGCTECHKEKK